MAENDKTLTARIESVILETDAPDVLVARDGAGAAYLCALTARDRDGDHFLAVQVSSRRLGALRGGALDLRSALVDPENGLQFAGNFFRDGVHSAIRLRLIDDVPEAWLPETGFLLTAFSRPLDEDSVLGKAQDAHAAVVHCHFTPVESLGATLRISANHLADGVRAFQTLVKHAYRMRVASLESRRRAQFGSDGFVLEAVGVSHESFCVHFESRQRADLVGMSPVGLGLTKVDELMKCLDLPPEAGLEVLRQNRGHVVSAFRHVLELASKGVPLEYVWAEPAMESASGFRVTPEAAVAVGALLDSEKELTVEEVRFTATFYRVSADKGTWSARDSNGKLRHGTVHEEDRGVLDGVVINTLLYDSVCEERLVENATGRQVLRLYLRTVAPTSAG